MVCVCCVEEKKIRDDDEHDARMKKMYILGTNTAVMWKGLNVERLITGCNITGGCRIMENKTKQTMC